MSKTPGSLAFILETPRIFWMGFYRSSQEQTWDFKGWPAYSMDRRWHTDHMEGSQRGSCYSCPAGGYRERDWPWCEPQQIRSETVRMREETKHGAFLESLLSKSEWNILLAPPWLPLVILSSHYTTCNIIPLMVTRGYTKHIGPGLLLCN